MDNVNKVAGASTQGTATDTRKIITTVDDVKGLLKNFPYEDSESVGTNLPIQKWQAKSKLPIFELKS